MITNTIAGPILTTALQEKRQLLLLRRFIFVSILLFLPVLLTFIIRSSLVREFNRFPSGSTDGPPEMLAGLLFAGFYYYLLYPWLLSLFISILWGSSLIQTEVENKTITYLLIAPTPRWTILLGKYLSAVVCQTVFCWASFFLSWLLVSAPGGLNFLITFLFAIFFAVLVYTAVFLFIGLLIPARALMIGVVYALIFELVISFVPIVINNLSFSYYIRSFIMESLDLDIPREFLLLVGDLGIFTSSLILITSTIVVLGVSMVIFKFREFNITEKV